MDPWIFVHLQDEAKPKKGVRYGPGESIMLEYKQTFDAWQDGGVKGIVVGRLTFQQPDGTKLLTWQPDPKVYESYGVSPPLPQPRDLEKEKHLHAMLDDAASRDWQIMIFVSHPPHGRLPFDQDPFGAISGAAGVQDMMNAYPQVSGHIIDGPGEGHYELSFIHGGELFEVMEHHRNIWSRLGKDVDRAERGMEHLRDRFHHLTPSLVRYHAPGGLLGGLLLFDFNEDALYWLRARQETAIAMMAALREQYDKFNRKIALGGIPRTATFSALTGQNYERMAQYFDHVFPKHYFWHRGYDGMYGSIARWVRRLSKWNPSLSEADCFSVVKSWFGISLPGVASIAEMDRGFPDEFFSEIVYSETARAIEAVGEHAAGKIIPWVSTGRSPHGGDQMSSGDLYRMLKVTEQAGAKRFLFHSTIDMGAAEWQVISDLCGNRWNEDPNGYWPLDTEKPHRWDGGRTPTQPE